MTEKDVMEGYHGWLKIGDYKRKNGVTDISKKEKLQSSLGDLSDSLTKTSKEGEKRDTCLIIWIKDLYEMTFVVCMMKVNLMT